RPGTRPFTARRGQRSALHRRLPRRLAGLDRTAAVPGLHARRERLLRPRLGARGARARRLRDYRRTRRGPGGRAARRHLLRQCAVEPHAGRDLPVTRGRAAAAHRAAARSPYERRLTPGRVRRPARGLRSLARASFIQATVIARSRRPKPQSTDSVRTYRVTAPIVRVAQRDRVGTAHRRTRWPRAGPIFADFASSRTRCGHACCPGPAMRSSIRLLLASAVLAAASSAQSLLRDIRVQPPQSNPGSGVLDLTDFGNLVLFGAFDSARGPQLWRTDGTSAGTSPVTAFPVQETVYFQLWTTVARNGLLVFPAGPMGDRELWRTDGTRTGTYRIADIRPGP